MAILASITIVTIVTMSAQQVYAPRDCAGCAQFKKLTNEFEKDGLDVAILESQNITKIEPDLNHESLLNGDIPLIPTNVTKVPITDPLIIEPLLNGDNNTDGNDGKNSRND